MQIPHFAGEYKPDLKAVKRADPARYTEFSRAVRSHNDEIADMNCNLKFKKFIPLINVKGDEFFRLTSRPEQDAAHLAKLDKAGYKYRDGVQMDMPLIGRKGSVSAYVTNAVEFAKKFGDALRKPSPHVSPYLIKKDKDTAHYEAAKQAFAAKLEPAEDGEAPEIQLPDTVQVKLTRNKAMKITVPQPNGKTFVKTLRFNPDLEKIRHSEAKEEELLPLFIEDGLQYAQRLADDLKVASYKPVVPPKPDAEVRVPSRHSGDGETEDL